MLTLLLLRHAKAEAARGDDFARALTDKGERDAIDVGNFLTAHRLRPDMALVSAALRTSRTFDLVAEGLSPGFDVHREEALYNAGENRIYARLAQVGADKAVVLIVGHNPGIMEAAVTLAQEGDLAEIERLRGRFPPCGLAVISFSAEDWADALASGGRLDALVFPDDLVSGA